MIYLRPGFLVGCRLRMAVLTVLVFIVILADGQPCGADVCFVHDSTTVEYVVGEKEAQLIECYSGNSKAVDKTTGYTGSFLKRWFGGVKSFRATTFVLLDQDVIREVDYTKNKAIDFPLSKITDPDWYNRYSEDDIPKDTQAHLDRRYLVQDPEFDFRVDPAPVVVSGYPCRHLVADLRLETRDKKKKASSITHVRQEVWISEAVPGFDEYEAFHRNLVDRLGIDAERLGVFSGLLDYWQGSLAPFRAALGDIKGYPVQKTFVVRAVYRADAESGDPVVTEKEITRISEKLRSVDQESIPPERFLPPPDFRQVTAE